MLLVIVWNCRGAERSHAPSPSHHSALSEYAGQSTRMLGHPSAANESQRAAYPETAEKTWEALLFLVAIIPTIGGNILVILAVSLEKKLQNATNYFLMSLAVADLLVGLFVMPIALLTILFNSEWPLHNSLCSIWLFLDILFSTASIMHLCAISLDRYVAIKKPIQASQFNSRAKTVIKIAIVWLISIGIAIPIPIQGIKDESNIFENKTCIVRPERFKDFITYGSLVAFFIPFGIMVVIYLLTIQALRKKAYLIKNKPPQRLNWSTVSTVFQRDMTPCSSPEKVAMLNGSKKDKGPVSPHEEMPIRRMSSVGKKSMQTITNEQRASKVLGIVFFLFVLMWCPFFITNVASVLCDSCDKKLIQKLMEIFVWVGYVSSGVNPLVYTLFNQTFRQAFSRYITCNYQTMKPVRALRRCSSRISFRNSMAENSKLIMKHGMRNGINPVMYQSPLRLRNSQTQSSAILLDTLLLTENEVDKTEEQVSYV
ncbi:5-hydroxytryptamine receptor 2B [Rhinatrema bivittatum]|uniref:5-hydroxytryptamine receptor 2B n=1 Tax=Rhinatrema bivittatum TaxID=194408 RepID=UPI001129745B|nr:5-hydroxytryptamine receptor 2B [Rhinatrema bivittatum]